MKITLRQLRQIVREATEVVQAQVPAVVAAIEAENEEEDPRRAEDRWERREEELYESLRSSLHRALIKEQNKVGGDIPRDIFTPGQAALEITDPKVTADQINEFWPNVVYNGQDVMDLIYDELVVTDAESAISDVTGENFEGQESYLGYVRDKDMFVMGFDVWLDDGMTSGIAEISPRGRVQWADAGGEGGMYPDGYNMVKSMYPGIVDLRLD